MKMRYFLGILILTLFTSEVANAGSKLLEGVKRNKDEAIALCRKFRALNSKGLSATSADSIKEIAKQRNLSITDAEILSIYVIGLNCPGVR